VTLQNVDGEIGGLSISDPPTQAQVQALRDRCEEVADDVRALSTLVHALRVARSLQRKGQRSEPPAAMRRGADAKRDKTAAGQW
jgi:hypothetical protein